MSHIVQQEMQLLGESFTNSERQNCIVLISPVRKPQLHGLRFLARRLALASNAAIAFSTVS